MTDARHPLLASEVIRLSGTEPAPDDAHMSAQCSHCGERQSLADATVEPADDPQDITAYRCLNGCAVLATVGHPNPVPLPGSGRYRFGDYALAPQAPEVLLITMPSGREIRLAPPRPS